MEVLEQIKELIRNGKRETAYQEVLRVVKYDPANKDAWWLMLALLDDDATKAECYRQILKIDPQDQTAHLHLEQLTSSTNKAETEQEHPFHCRQCGGDLEVHFIGDLRDKWAVCPYCGGKIDIKDSYRRFKHTKKESKGLLSSKTVETTVIETRSDKPLEELSPEEAELMKRMGISPEFQKTTGKSSYSMKFSKNSKLNDLLGGLNLSFENDDLGSLSDAAHVIRTVSGKTNIVEPLAPEERTKCPHCDATVSIKAVKCDWCGKSPEEEEDQ
jgi:DNA-directed RNA polymerase subunit RPC12/RpoP